MLRCGNVRVRVPAVNAANKAAGSRKTVRGPGLPSDHLSGRENGSELERPPSTAKAWPLA
jgi:hypothetical protein